MSRWAARCTRTFTKERDVTITARITATRVTPILAPDMRFLSRETWRGA